MSIRYGGVIPPFTPLGVGGGFQVIPPWPGIKGSMNYLRNHAAFWMQELHERWIVSRSTSSLFLLEYRHQRAVGCTRKNAFDVAYAVAFHRTPF